MQKTELTEFSSASARVIVPNSSGPLWSAKLNTCLPKSVQKPGSSNTLSGVNRPVSIAAEAVMTLKVEPGTKRPAVARSSSGEAGLQGAVIASIESKSVSTRFGLKDGAEASARTRPVDGSSATAAPHLPARPSTAARWVSRSMVVTRSFPSRGIPRIVSRVVSKSVLRFAFEAVR